MQQRIIIETSLNSTPEVQLNERVAPLIADGFRITSATTALALHGNTNIDRPDMWMNNVPEHTCFVTTVVLEKL